MKPDTVVSLGGFEFQTFEVPERLPFGGEQALVVHKLIGGTRIVDAMGRDDREIAWSGMFLGKDADSRANELDAMRIAGKPLTLTWGSKSFVVVIASFTPIYANFHEIPYGISCEVVSNLGLPPTLAAANPGLDDQIGTDLAAAQGYGGLIDDATLTSLMGDLQDAVDSVDTFIGATAQELQSVINPLIATQAQVRNLIAVASPLIDTVAAIGGVLPFAPFGSAVASLQNQINAFNDVGYLYSLQSLLGRMSTNLSADGVSGSIVTTAGGDLYHLAAIQYGDATAWTTIARANSLTDPVLQGIQSLTIPQTPDGTDGVLTH